jgi:hypothetical protein
VRVYEMNPLLVAVLDTMQKDEWNIIEASYYHRTRGIFSLASREDLNSITCPMGDVHGRRKVHQNASIIVDSCIQYLQAASRRQTIRPCEEYPLAILRVPDRKRSWDGLAGDPSGNGHPVIVGYKKE